MKIKIKIPSAVEYIIDRLNNSGYEAYLVGGCVRDALMGLPVHDYDITTSAFPNEMRVVFKDDKIIPTGEKHGTLTVCHDHMHVEVTTYRTEKNYQDHRHPSQVQFVRNLKEDLSRRDFTINAMAYHPDQSLVDYFGGQQDIARKRIRCVGEPMKRFDEDALRILRAIRFAARLQFSFDSETRKAMSAEKELLLTLSAERITAETKGILAAPYAQEVLAQVPDIMKTIWPQIQDPLTSISGLNEVPADFILRFAYMLRDVRENDMLALLRKMKLSGDEQVQIRALYALENQPLPDSLEKTRKLVGQYGMMLVRQSLCLNRPDTAMVGGWLDEIEQKHLACAIPDLAIHGNQLYELGYRKQEIHQMQEELLEQVLQNKLANDPEQLIQYAKDKSACH